MSEVITLCKASINRNQLSALVFGYALSSKSILPHDVICVIDKYIPKFSWLKTGDNCTISGPVLIYPFDVNYDHRSTGYSSQTAIIDSKSLASTYYKHIWEVKIVEKKQRLNGQVFMEVIIELVFHPQ